MIRDLMKLPAIALLALAAACGGGGEKADAANTGAEATQGADATVTQSPEAASQTAPTPAAQGNVVEVRMVTTDGGASGRFEPAQVTVKKGDVIRWVMADAQAAHNVSFTQGQNNPAGFTPPADSPYLNQAGQTFEVTVDWAAGTYNYVCVPHAPTGMVGSVTVQ